MKLADIAGATLGPAVPDPSALLACDSPARVGELLELLRERNGFFAFDDALHVFPAGRSTVGPDLATWNAPGGWRDGYGDQAEGLFFFAQDLFGGQFAIGRESVLRFDPETGGSEVVADSIGAWLARLVEDPAYETGQPIAIAWRGRHGPIPPGERLVPKVPFVLSGSYELANLYTLDAAQAMAFFASIARQIREVPDGAKVRLVVADRPGRQQL